VGLLFAGFFGALHKIGEFAKMFQSVALPARHVADSGRHHVNMRAIQEFLLDAVVAFALRELLVGQLAVEGDDARKILLELAGKDEAAFLRRNPRASALRWF